MRELLEAEAANVRDVAEEIEEARSKVRVLFFLFLSFLAIGLLGGPARVWRVFRGLQLLVASLGRQARYACCEEDV